MLYRLILLAVTICLPLGATAEDRSWIERSDRISAIVFDSLGAFQPELFSVIGLERFDTEVFDLKPRRAERFAAAANTVLQRLYAAHKTETHPKVKQDIALLIDWVERQRRTRALEYRLLVPYLDLPRQIFEGLREVLDARNPEARRANALPRLRRYVGMDGGQPLAELAKARMIERFSVPGITWPYAGEVSQHLGNCARYVAGIAELFRARAIAGWEAAHERLAAQLAAYCGWVKTSILPKARAQPMLPRELYADRLKNVGIDIDPEQAIALGKFAFAEVRDEMARLAVPIARERKLAAADYREVLRALKRDAVPADRIIAFYRERLARVEEIMAREHLMTLPQRAASIRLASEAESAAIPAPFMNPPRLIGNRGEVGEFVLPLTNPNAKTAEPADDFTAEATSWTMIAHELRPGHELQFAAMVERGVSLARAAFAFNSTNVEGWALYAESIMAPYFPPEGQLFSLQLRLLRAARAFLDPMVNLGMMTPAAAKEFLMREVVLSEPMAQQEADRYAFEAPGQAGSYLYGYRRLRELRLKAEIALGPRFDQRAFHDLVIAQGLLPPRLLERAVLEELGRR